MHAPDEPPPPSLRPSGFSDWPWFFNPEYFSWAILVVWYILFMSLCLFLGSFRLMIPVTALCAVYALMLLAVRLFSMRNDYWIPLSRPKDLPKICTTCGYDLRATPLRCPECGTHTPFKEFLDEHPLDRAIYEKRLKPQGKTSVAR